MLSGDVAVIADAKRGDSRHEQRHRAEHVAEF